MLFFSILLAGLLVSFMVQVNDLGNILSRKFAANTTVFHDFCDSTMVQAVASDSSTLTVSGNHI